MDKQESLGKRLTNFGVLLAVVAVVTLVIVVTQRLSSDALAILIGLGAGVLVMVPVAALALVLWRRETRHRQEQSQKAQLPQPQQPPVIVVAPPSMPYGVQQQGRLEQTPDFLQQAPRERRFMIVGGEEEEDVN